MDLDSDPEVIRYTQARIRYGGKPPSIEIFQNEILPGFISLYTKFPDFGFFAAFEKSSDEFLGWFHLVPDEGSRRAELGYRLKRKYWGHGLATEGSKALIEKGFKDLGLIEVFSGAMIDNSASIRVMEKCGLKFIKNYHHETYGEAVKYKISVEEWQKNVDLTQINIK
jgi:RimJ/RimL family protein N-acetyltransferase